MEYKVRILPPLPLGFEAFPLRVGVLDLAQSTACGPARRIGASLLVALAHDSGLTQDLRARVRDQRDAPTCDTNESSTGAFQNGEQGFPKWRSRCGFCPLCRWF